MKTYEIRFTTTVVVEGDNETDALENFKGLVENCELEFDYPDIKIEESKLVE